MAEPYLRQSALAHRHLQRSGAAAVEGAGIVMAERPFRALVNLRGDADDASFLATVRAVAEIDLPLAANTTCSGAGVTALWLGPDEWLIVAPAGVEQSLTATLKERLKGHHAAVVDVTETRTIIAVAGERARDLLAKGCTLDLHPRAFQAGSCAQTGLARTAVLIHLVDAAPSFEIHVARSFADHLWAWLYDAAGEYGIAIAAT